MEDENPTNSAPEEVPQETPGEKVDRGAEAQKILLAMVQNKELPEDALKKLASRQAVGLTPEQEKQNERETADLTLGLLVEQMFIEHQDLGGQNDANLRKYLIPKVQEDILTGNIIGDTHDKFREHIYQSVKKHIADYVRKGPDQKLEHWYAGVNAHELIHHTLRNCEEFTGRSFESYNLGNRDEEGIVSEALKAVHEKDPKSREEADVIIRDVISKRLDVFADLAATLNYAASKQSDVHDTRDTRETVKEKNAVKRKYGKYSMIAAAGIAAAYLAIAGGAHIGYKLEEWLNAPSKVVVTENTTNLENRVNDIQPNVNVPENVTAQKPVNEAVEDYNENAPVPEEVKSVPAPAAQANQVNQEIPLPDIYVPAVPGETRKEISKETFEAMYVLAKTKIQEKISNYAELWNQFFQNAQTPVQIIPKIPAQISKQVQKDNFIYVHEPSRKNTARNKSKAYVSANVGVIMPIRSDIYRQGAITVGLSAGVANETDTELNIGAEIFKTSANGNEKGTDWSAESKNFLVRVGARRNFPKQGTYVETDLEGLFSKSRFIVGYEYNVNEPDSSVTAGFGVGAGINTKNAEFGVRYIHFFNSGEVGHAVAVCAGCKF
jgi:hypothetical protein